MIRQVIKIDEEKCTGCGICVNACHESALAIIDGKAKLVRDDYCDGLGNCLPACPTGAISFETREAAEFDKEAVEANMRRLKELAGKEEAEHQHHHGCPGAAARAVTRNTDSAAVEGRKVQSQLLNWPVQIQLAPVKAPYFDGAKLLIAADCSAYAYGNFHNELVKGRITLIGCPKLDDVDYTEKLTEIIRNNDIKAVTIVRMEVPCCAGIAMAAQRALQDSGKFIPWQVVTISIDGNVID